jgi:riboflavin kinase/FMN adenylyltransferase
VQIFRHIDEEELSIAKPVLTMGNFDGIHLGHQALLRQVVQEAKAQRGCSVILTFEPHPLRILAPNHAPRLILTHKDKMRFLQFLGLDVVIIQKFDAAFAGIEAQEFVRRYLIDRLNVHQIWVGKDFRFGKGRKGRVEDLMRWASEGNFEVRIVEPVLAADLRVSSSRIRQLIGRGDVDQASGLLGRYHLVSGRVVRGHQRGRNLGFPTANIVPQTEVLPADGIYATLLEIDEHRWPSVTSIGVNPTFGQGPRTIESYLFDFHKELYDRSVKLFFVKRIREERKFPSADLLVEQMKKDALSARELLSGLGPDERTGLIKSV